MQDRYSVFGPPPRLPADMLRSILLSVEVKITSYTRWADNLKENLLHAILSGFTVGDTPGTGTFYDFQSRLWLSDSKNLSVPVHPSKQKPKKPDISGEKALPVEKVTVKELFEKFEQESPSDITPCKLLYDLFRQLFLTHSADTGLIILMHLYLAVDGTPVYTAARERKKRTCKCTENGIYDCKCDQISSQPDCNIGCNSHPRRFYFGYDLYMLTASDSDNDLPIFPFLSRHPDMTPTVSFITGFP